MGEDYCRLLSELQEAKRQINQLKNKINNLNADNAILESNAITDRKTINTLKTQIASLEVQNTTLLKAERENKQNYEREIQEIKSEIDKRQALLSPAFRGEGDSANLPFLRKQIQYENQLKNAEALENQQSKINALQQRINQIIREKQLEKEKHSNALQSAQKQINELEEKHLRELKESAQKAYKDSEKRIFNSDEAMIKRMRRELNQLRNNLSEKDNQIETLLDEKNLLVKQKNNVELKLGQQTCKFNQSLKILKFESASSKQIQDLSNLEKQHARVRELQKQLKKMKEKNNQLHDQLVKKQEKMSNLQIQNQDLIDNKRLGKQRDRRQEEQRLRTLRKEKQALQRQARTLAEENKHIKQKYQTTLDEVHKTTKNQIIRTEIETITNNDTTNYKNLQSSNPNPNLKDSRFNSSQRNQDVRYRDNSNEHKLTSQILNKRNITNEDHVRNRSTYNERNGENYNERNRESYNERNSMDRRNREVYAEQKVEEEREKVREIGRKYLDLQKKYGNVKKKLEEANDKILDLIRSKIGMASPPKPTDNTLNLSRNLTQLDRIKMQKKQREHKWTSPQIKNNQDLQNLRFIRSSSPKQREFYEKSLNLKNKRKLKDLKCNNHQHVEDQSNLVCTH